MRGERTPAALAPLVLLAALTGAACGDAEAADDAREATIYRSYQFDDDALDPAVQNGLAVAAVIARGTGCPEGSWFTEIADDGRRFRVRLIGYEVGLADEAQTRASSACTLSIQLRSRVPVSFAVKSIAAIGYAYLDPGVRARFSTRPYFPEGPHQGRGAALELVGPFEDNFSQQAETDALVWSACGVAREVAVDTRLSVHNSTARGVGFIGIGEAHAALPGAADAARFGITFAVRTCGDPVDGGPPSPHTDADAGAPSALILRGSHDASVPATERDSSVH